MSTTTASVSTSPEAEAPVARQPIGQPIGQRILSVAKGVMKLNALIVIAIICAFALRAIRIEAQNEVPVLVPTWGNSVHRDGWEATKAFLAAPFADKVEFRDVQFTGRTNKFYQMGDRVFIYNPATQQWVQR